MDLHIDIERSNLHPPRRARRWVVAVLLVCGLGLPAMGATAWAANAGWLSDPPANIPFTGPLTVTNELANINYAHRAEGVPPIALPSNWGQLTVAQQLFVIINLERTSRGLAPIDLLSSVASQCALEAASLAQDPEPTLPSCQSAIQAMSPLAWTGIMASSGTPRPLFDDYIWMYADGPGAADFNIDCTNSDPAGCWGHRHNILYVYDSAETVMGAATSSVTWPGTDDAFTMWLPSAPGASQLGSVFTWAQEEPFLQTSNVSGLDAGSYGAANTTLPHPPVIPICICGTRAHGPVGRVR